MLTGADKTVVHLLMSEVQRLGPKRVFWLFFQLL